MNLPLLSISSMCCRARKAKQINTLTKLYQSSRKLCSHLRKLQVPVLFTPTCYCMPDNQPSGLVPRSGASPARKPKVVLRHKQCRSKCIMFPECPSRILASPRAKSSKSSPISRSKVQRAPDGRFHAGPPRAPEPAPGPGRLGRGRVTI